MLVLQPQTGTSIVAQEEQKLVRLSGTNQDLMVEGSSTTPGTDASLAREELRQFLLEECFPLTSSLSTSGPLALSQQAGPGRGQNTSSRSSHSVVERSAPAATPRAPVTATIQESSKDREFLVAPEKPEHVDVKSPVARATASNVRLSLVSKLAKRGVSLSPSLQQGGLKGGHQPPARLEASQGLSPTSRDANPARQLLLELEEVPESAELSLESVVKAALGGGENPVSRQDLGHPRDWGFLSSVASGSEAKGSEELLRSLESWLDNRLEGLDADLVAAAQTPPTVHLRHPTPVSSLQRMINSARSTVGTMTSDRAVPRSSGSARMSDSLRQAMRPPRAPTAVSVMAEW